MQNLQNKIICACGNTFEKDYGNNHVQTDYKTNTLYRIFECKNCGQWYQEETKPIIKLEANGN